ncbi:hypothetical protein FDP41_005735 [Naegleria fowleri]|uniref:Uncharacterized protein n=1 Tax=Naegleria fowleri TaxID=5763 RepID=A0A6A5BJD2_NAEFO|nr:uncharacterized protein FDP41_005735 [Naegleria fowleri]KAF0974982.1 hypothetical protein FDP41_005735 [Naegleria fowleri]
MPAIFIGGSPRITLFFIGLLLFFQFFNHIMDYYSGDYSSSSSYFQDHQYNDLGFSSDTKTFTFPRKILSIPSSRLLNRFKISQNNTMRSSKMMNHYSTLLLTSQQFLKNTFHIKTDVDGTSEEIKESGGHEKRDVFVKVILEEDTFLRDDATLGSMAKILVFSLKNSNDMNHVSLTDLNSITHDTPLSWEIEYEETLIDSKIYFSRKGTSQFNKDCVYVVTEHISSDSFEKISKTMELRKFCPQKERNRFFNLTNFGLEILSIADTSLDEDCAIISFVDDIYEFRMICSNGTSIFHGPSMTSELSDNKSTKIPKVKDLHDVLSVHELNTKESPHSVFTFKEHSDVNDIRNQLYYSMYDHVTKQGPQVQLHLYYLGSNTSQQQQNWVHQRLDPSISGSLTAIYSRNAHRLRDVYYKGVEISYQSENGKVVVFPLHGGALYVMRSNEMGGITVEKSTYYSFIGNGFGLYDLRTLQERYYAQDHFSLAFFEAMKKRMEKYSHPNQVAINVDGSYIIVVHYQLFAFVFKQAGKGLALQSVLKNVHFARENSHLKSSFMGIQSLHFVSPNVVAVLCEDGSVEMYDVEHELTTSSPNVNQYGISSEGKHEETESGILGWFINEFVDKPVLFSILVLMIGLFIYNEVLIRKRIQAHRTQYQQQQQQQAQQPTGSSSNSQ